MVNLSEYVQRRNFGEEDGDVDLTHTLTHSTAVRELQNLVLDFRAHLKVIALLWCPCGGVLHSTISFTSSKIVVAF